MRTLLEGLSAFKETNDSMPSGYDVGVLHAWMGVGKIFSRGIDGVTFTLLGTEAPISYDFDLQVFEKIELLSGKAGIGYLSGVYYNHEDDPFVEEIITTGMELDI